MILGIIAVICILAALGLMGMFFKKKKEEEEKKGFLVIAGSIIFIYLFPSAALFVIGALCLMALLGGWM